MEMQGYQPISQDQTKGQYTQTPQSGVPGGYVPPKPPGGYVQSPNPQGYVNKPIPNQGYGASPMYNKIQYVYAPDPMIELSECNRAYIKQEPQFYEQITGWEAPNRYFVFSESPKGGIKLLFKCKEFSDWCDRNCCSASSREFHMFIKHIGTDQNLDDNFRNTFVNVNKPFTCTCCCCCCDRPVMFANYSRDRKPLGRIKELCSCCDPEFYTYDSFGKAKYYITGDYCQCGLCCGGMCEKLSEVVFNIFPAEKTTIPCGSIIKKPADFAELITSADSYQVNFPNNAKPEDKMMLIIATLMIDYQYFEVSASANKKGRRHRRYYY